MCTVSFIPSGGKYFLTSSRDEKAGRATALFPDLYEINGQLLLFPKDQQAGGTWIAVHQSGNAAVLLNGAIRAHRPEPAYRKSRGLVLLDLIAQPDLVQAFAVSDLNGIEPFTLILFENNKLWSARWDGKKKKLESLIPHRPHIWSSVTLYGPAVIQKRETWFRSWLAENPNPSMADIIRFHKNGGDGDPVNDILMNRQGRLFTNSISSIRLSADAAAFHYTDMRSGETAVRILPLERNIPVKA
jgi:hypothetical protein